ncbi:ABC transporter permease [Cereibacter changlensis]|uniref:ABC transporter permease n=1 Tax=Cereibacter changlensis TaxID=402884 RepID=A0A4V5NLS2_9RHOB|nr:ABC transporter permease [Cereibacter changlensis]TKA96717.1 ABC transporter permease [Cereibacter changlensis]
MISSTSKLARLARDGATPPVPQPRAPSLRGRLTQIAANRSAAVGGAVVLLYILAALIGPVIWPLDPYAQDLANRLVPPAWYPKGMMEHPLGTDSLGRDLLGRVLYGSRISLAIGFGAASVGALVGVTLGAYAGYFGGRVDRVVTFVLTCRLALPSILLAMTMIYFISPSVTAVIVVIGLLHWTYFLMVCRSSTRRIRELDYVRAARISGASAAQIIRWDVLPNLAGTISVVFTYEVAASILAESALSFLGVGIPSPMPSWGLMIAEGKNLMLFNPWLVVIPGLALFGLVMAVNLLGDGLRDVFQPQLKG